MRLNARERAAIKDAVQRADPDAKIYLFGSRVDDLLRGGDIDLLVLSDRISLPAKLDILAAIKQSLGEQKIDLLVRTAKEAAADPFAAGVLKTAVPL